MRPPWVYIRTYHPGVFPWEVESLYNLADDLHEEVNQADRAVDVISGLRSDLTSWYAKTAEAGQIDPMDEVIGSGGPYRYVKVEPWIRHLQAIGEMHGANRVRQRIQFRQGRSVTP